MTKRSLCCLFFFFFVYLGAIAQRPDERLARWAAQSPVEKAYLHLDRDNYIAGETAWFKAYLSADYYPDTISTTLYVELVNENSGIVNRQVLPVFWGVARGQLEIPDTAAMGSYMIRAYTATMLNQDEAFIFRRNIFIYNKKNNFSKDILQPAPGIRVELFPEGGNLVNGLRNTIAFKASSQDGMPVAVSGAVYNEKGNSLATFSSYHDGMGMFDITPVAGEKYYLSLTGNGQRYYLPESTGKGISLMTSTDGKNLYYEIKQRLSDPVFTASYVVGQMQHRVVFRQDVQADREELKAWVNTQQLNSGILQVTVFNRDGVPLAERLCFIDNKEYLLAGELVADTANFTGRGKNHFSLVLNDTVRGNFSVAITDPAFDIAAERAENIVSTFLLTSDIKGYVHNPAWYFKNGNDSARAALDLVMMTNGWRRFDWKTLAGSTITANRYNDLAYITLEGKVYLQNSKRPFAEKEVLLQVTSADSTSTMQLINTDAEGNFRLDSMYFNGTADLLFSDVRKKGKQAIDVRMSADSVARLFPFQPAERIAGAADLAAGQFFSEKWASDYDEISRAEGLMLEEVTLKSKRKTTPTEELDQKYTSGIFTTRADRTADLVNTKELFASRSVIDYVRSNFPSISLVAGGPGLNYDYELFYRGARTSSILYPQPMILYLNEMLTDAATLATLQVGDVALIKVFGTFAGAPGNGAGGVLAVYTKKASEITRPLSSDIYRLKYSGYSVSKEFYSPDYTVSKEEKGKADNRVTLQWIPDLFVSDINPRLPVVFFNNDRTKRFKVVVEGMSADGKLLMIEKTISPAAF